MMLEPGDADFPRRTAGGLGTELGPGPGNDAALRQALRESEERYRQLLRTVNEGIVILDPEARVLEASDRMGAMLGVSVTRLIGRPIFDFTVDPATAQRRFEERKRGIEECFDVTLRRANGSQFRAIVSSTPVFHDGQFAGVMSAITDVTEHRQAEADRDRLFVLSLDLVCTVGEEGYFRSVNPAFERGLGFTSAELLSRPCLDFIHPDDHAASCSAVEGAFAGRDVAHFENRYVCADGSVRWIAWTCPAIRPGEDFVYAVGRDVTDRRNWEEALRRSEASLARAQRIVRMGCFEADLVRQEVFWSEEMHRLLDLALGEAGPSLEAIVERVHPDDRKRILKVLDDTREKGRSHNVDLRIVRRDGTPRTVNLQVELVRDESGSPVRVLGTLLDITQRKELEDQLRHAQKMEAVGRLAGGVAHDFNNMLAVINGYSEILFPLAPPESPLHTGLRDIRRAGERAASLTRQLLAYSRKQILEPKDLDLNSLTIEVRSMLQPLLGEAIELRLELDPRLGRVRADPGQIEQVLVNLAVNARDAMPEGGTLTVETRNVELTAAQLPRHAETASGPYVMIAVTDTGIGMTQDTLTQIFEPFFTTKPMGQGTGLGLATADGIVKQSGGHIDVRSEPNRGTRFSIYLPRIPEVSADTADPLPGAPPRGTETVLLVEDEAMVRDLVRSILQNSGYTVLEAVDGSEALRTAEQHGGQISLLITDVIMPRMNGRELAERLRSARPEIPVLYMSGRTDDVAALLPGQPSEGTACVRKPFSPAALARQVRELLG